MNRREQIPSKDKSQFVELCREKETAAIFFSFQSGFQSLSSNPFEIDEWTIFMANAQEDTTAKVRWAVSPRRVTEALLHVLTKT